MSPRSVPEAELQAALVSWRRDGFARLPAVADAQTCAGLRDRLQSYVDGARPDPGLFFQPDAPSGDYADVVSGDGYAGPDVAYRKIEKLHLDPLFWAWLSNPLFGRIARAVFEDAASLYRATAFIKVAHKGSDLPWHQDGGLFWGLDRDPCLQVWTALDDAPEQAGCLEFVPGSHLRGLATPRGGLVPASMGPAVEGSAVAVPARAGDVVLVHNLVWHRSGANRTSQPRRAFSVSYLHGQTRCTRKRRAPRAFMPVFPGGYDI